MNHPEDLDLIRSALADDLGARDRLATRLACVGRILRARARALCGGLPDPDLLDIAQDVLTRVWAKLPTYAGYASIESWVYSFCEGELRNALRRRRRRPTDSAVDLDSSLAAEPEPEMHDDLLACLDRLPTGDLQLVRWKHYDGLRLEEIARRIDVNLNTTKSRYYRALLQLRQCLERGNPGSSQ